MSGCQASVQFSSDEVNWFTGVKVTEGKAVKCSISTTGTLHVRAVQGNVALAIGTFGNVSVIETDPASALPIQLPLRSSSPSGSQEDSTCPSSPELKSLLKKPTRKSDPAKKKKKVRFSDITEKSFGDGLIYRVTKPGNRQVLWHYKVRLSINGEEKVVNSLNSLPECLKLTCNGMLKDEERQITIPANLDKDGKGGVFVVRCLGQA